MKFTSVFFALPLLAVQVLAVAVTPNETVVKRSTVQKRQFKSALKCDSVPQCTATCSALIPEIEKCTWVMEGTTRQGTSNVKCLCTPAFIALAVANYNCEIPLGLSNLRAISADRKPNMDRLHAESQIQNHVAQCKALGIDLTPGLPQLVPDTLKPLDRDVFFPNNQVTP
jgi:hypothetical protein